MEQTIDDLRAEVERLKAGNFTEEEFQNLCHNLDGSDADRFRAGCRSYQQKLFSQPKETYKLISADDYDGFKQLVCAAIYDGWYPHDAVVIEREMEDSSLLNALHITSYTQAMVNVPPLIPRFWGIRHKVDGNVGWMVRMDGTVIHYQSPILAQIELENMTQYPHYRSGIPEDITQDGYEVCEITPDTAPQTFPK